MIRPRVTGFAVRLRTSIEPDRTTSNISTRVNSQHRFEGMKTDRPINLSLTKFSFPLAAIASITHRITGTLLFVGIAFLLYLLDQSLTSAQGLEHARTVLTLTLPKLLLIAVVATLIYHFVAGVKHLFLDFDIGDTTEGGRLAAQLTIAISVVLIGLAGVWLW